MGNFIVDARIKKLEAVKQSLLTMKKRQRGDELEQVNQMIARLKGWNLELQKGIDANVPRNTSPNIGNYKKGTQTKPEKDQTPCFNTEQPKERDKEHPQKDVKMKTWFV
jgi:hypothetical protein